VLKISQIFVTGILGWFAYQIAKNQLSVNKNKLRFDLYEKRYGLYLKFNEFVSKIVRSAKASMDENLLFYFHTKESFFLMPEVYPYLEEIFQKANRLQYLNGRYEYFTSNPNSDHPDRNKLQDFIKEESEIVIWFHDQIDYARIIFGKYLSFPEEIKIQ